MQQSESSSSSLLLETAAQLRKLLGPQMDQLTVERTVIGIFFSGIKLSNGEGGICFTPVKEIPEAVCCPSSARAMPDSGKLEGQSVEYYIKRMRNGGPLQKALGIAVLNALSSTYWKMHPPTTYRLIKAADPVENRPIDDDARVVVIGALVPYIRMLKSRGKPFSILEKDARTLKPDEMDFFVPQERAAECITEADLLIITGTTLINDTLESILAMMKISAKAIVVGPTASMLPDSFFDRGVTSIGGITTTNADLLLATLAEAGSGYHFYGKSAERLVIEK